MSYDLYVEPGPQSAEPTTEAMRQAVIDLPGCTGGAGPCYEIVPEGITLEQMEGVPAEGSPWRIILNIPLGLIDSAGEHAISMAFDLAKTLGGWIVYDPQLLDIIPSDDRERIKRAQQEWKASARQAVAAYIQKHPPFPPGWQQRDGWWVPPSTSKNDDVTFLMSPPPRAFGWWDQAKADARAPLAVLGWLGATASLVGGFVFFKWYLFALGVGWFWMFGPTFFRLIRLVREGQVRIFEVTTVAPVPLIRDKGSIELETWPGQKNGVIVPLGIAQALVQSGGLELRVLVGEKIEETVLIGMRGKSSAADS